MLFSFFVVVVFVFPSDCKADNIEANIEDESSKGKVDWGAVQEHGEGNDVRKLQRGLKYPEGSHQDPTAYVSSYRRQQGKLQKAQTFYTGGLSTAVAIQLRTASRH